MPPLTKCAINWLKKKKMPRPAARHTEHGNVFAIILLATILFAALIFVFSRGLNTGTTKLTQVEVRALAAEIINFGQVIDRAVQRIAQNGISENDLSFENGLVAGYDHSPAVSDRARVFGTNTGAGLTFRAPAPGSTPSTANQWLFTGGIIINGQGDDSFSELLLTLPVSQEMCVEINRQLGVAIDLSTPGTALTVTKFTGTYADDILFAVTTAAGAATGCYRGLATDGSHIGDYTFYQVLVAR
jgi:hypothetical protein